MRALLRCLSACSPGRSSSTAACSPSSAASSSTPAANSAAATHSLAPWFSSAFPTAAAPSPLPAPGPGMPGARSPCAVGSPRIRCSGPFRSRCIGRRVRAQAQADRAAASGGSRLGWYWLQPREGLSSLALAGDLDVGCAAERSLRGRARAPGIRTRRARRQRRGLNNQIVTARYLQAASDHLVKCITSPKGRFRGHSEGLGGECGLAVGSRSVSGNCVHRWSHWSRSAC